MKLKRNLIILLILATVSAGAAYLYFNKKDKTYTDTLADFSISDTAAVDKIIITDTEGRQITLKRGERRWTVNDSLEARFDLTSLILKVFKDIVVQAPLAESAKPNAIKRLAAFHKQVQIFQNGSDTPTKTWYVGDPTQSHFGTIVLLETPEDGKSETPYIIEVPWHNGFITPMFVPDVKAWMQTRVFDYPELEFSKVTVNHYLDPASSFSVEKNNGNYAVKSLQENQYLPMFDTLFVRDYVSLYSAIFYEVKDHYLTQHQTDSLLKSQPIYMISVTEESGKINQVKIFRKMNTEKSEDYEIPPGYDQNRYYAQLPDKQLVLIQKYSFDKLLIKLSDFK